MRLLVDTHIALWVLENRTKLMRAERELLADPRHDFFLSAASIWEVRIKWGAATRSGGRKLRVSPEILSAAADGLGWALLSITAGHAAATLDTPIPHNDPFDELLLAQAQVEGMRLLTRDGLLQDHPLALYA